MGSENSNFLKIRKFRKSKFDVSLFPDKPHWRAISVQEEYIRIQQFITINITMYYFFIIQFKIYLCFYFHGHSNDRLKSFRERKQRRIKLENEVCSEIAT